MRALPLALLLPTALFTLTAFGCSGASTPLPTAPDTTLSPTPVAGDALSERSNQGGPLGCSGDLLVTNTWITYSGPDPVKSSGMISFDTCDPSSGSISWSDFASRRTFSTKVKNSGESDWKGTWTTSTPNAKGTLREDGSVVFQVADKLNATIVTGTATITVTFLPASRGQRPTRTVTSTVEFIGVAR